MRVTRYLDMAIRLRIIDTEYGLAIIQHLVIIPNLYTNHPAGKKTGLVSASLAPLRTLSAASKNLEYNLAQSIVGSFTVKNHFHLFKWYFNNSHWDVDNFIRGAPA